VQVVLEELRAKIEHAFQGVQSPLAIREMLAAPYEHSEDALELAAAFHGHAWSEVPIRDLFRHREMLFALTPVAFRAYLPAYLVASLAAENSLDEYGADFREYLLDSLTADPEASADRVATTRARLATLSPVQRDVVVTVVRYLADRWHVKRADDAVRCLTAIEPVPCSSSNP
jgi:hypothetical protein